MNSASKIDQQLLSRAAGGDAGAVNELLTRYRPKLKKMVAMRMDRRLAARVDPSDVVQEAVMHASQRLPEYVRDPPMPFYPWLRRFACDRLADLGRRHIAAARRSVTREDPLGMALNDESVYELADRLVAVGSSPSRQMLQAERRRAVRAALERLQAQDRELLLLRYLEQLDTAEIAAVMGTTEGAVKGRHRRALLRLRELLGDGGSSN